MSETKKERRVREGKKDNDQHQRKRLTQGAAAAGVAAGLVAGGVPGGKPNPEEFKNVIQGKTLKERGKALYRSGRGGIFGYREQAHKKATKEFKADTDWYKGTGPATRVSDHYHRGRVEGKIRPEKKVIPHMRNARLLSNAGLLASAGLGAYATLSKRSGEDERGRRSGGGAAVAAGVGTTGGLGLLAGGNKLASEARVYRQAEKRDLARAHGLNPKLKPELRERELEDPKKAREVFRGYNRKQAEEQGKHRGRASQHRYFDRSYKMNAKWVKSAAYPLLAVGAAGAGGMLLAHKREEERLKKPQGKVKKSLVRKKAPKVLKAKKPPNTSGLKAPGTKIDRKGPHSRPFGV